MENLQDNLRGITNETCGITNSLDNLEGQMTFFGDLIQDCEQYPEISASYLKQGIIQKQLNAIYHLFHYQLQEIKKHNYEVLTLSSDLGEKKP